MIAPHAAIPERSADLVLSELMVPDLGATLRLRFGSAAVANASAQVLARNAALAARCIQHGYPFLPRRR